MDESIQRFINWITNNWYCVFIVLYVLASTTCTIITKVKKKEKVKMEDIITSVNLAELTIPGRHQGLTKKQFAIDLLTKKYKLSDKDIITLSNKIDDIIQLTKDLSINKGE